VGRQTASELADDFEAVLRPRGYGANVDALKWSQLWGRQFSLNQAAALSRGLRNTAYLSIASGNHLAPSTLADRVHRICYGFLDTYVLLMVSAWLMFFIYGSDPGNWALGLLAIVLCLGTIGYLTGPKEVPLPNLRKGVLLALRPFIFAFASPVFVVAILSVGPAIWWGLKEGLAFWPQTETLYNGLPVTTYMYGWLIPIVIVPMIVAVFFLVMALAGFSYKLYDTTLGQFMGLVLDVALYLGDTTHREQAQELLHKQIKASSEGRDYLVVGAHSLGSVLAIDTLRRFGLPPHLKKLVLVTGGSPLKRLFAPFFPDQYPSPADLCKQIRARHPAFSWFNVYRPKDPVGASLELGEGNDRSTSQPHGVLKAHPDYWGDQKIIDIALEFVDRSINEDPLANRDALESEEPTWTKKEYQRAFALPSHVNSLSGAKSLGWSLLLFFSLLAWLLLWDPLQDDRALAAFADAEQISGQVFARHERVLTKAYIGTDVKVWAMYSKDGNVACRPMEHGIDEQCVVDHYFPGAPGPSKFDQLGSCGGPWRMDGLHKDIGRRSESVLLVSDRYVGVPKCTGNPSKEWNQRTYKIVAWCLPLGAILLLIVGCFKSESFGARAHETT
jgi:hypothetical protein